MAEGKSSGQRSRSAKQSLGEAFAGLKDKELFTAITGRGDSSNTVLVPNRPGFIYIRIPKKVVTGTLEEFSEAQAWSTDEHRHGVPVFVSRAEDNPSRYEVQNIWPVGMGEVLIESALNKVMPHRQSHELFSTVGGYDPIMVDTAQLKNLQVTPTSPPSSSVRVNAGWYIWKDRNVHFFDGVDVELAARVPSGTFQATYVSLSLNPDTQEILQDATTVFNSPLLHPDIEDVLTWPVEGEIPLAGIRLTPGEYQVKWTDDKTPNIIDMRPHQSMMPGDMLPAGHPLDPDGGYHTGTLQAVHVAYDDASGTYAGENVQDILTELAGGAVGGASGTIPLEEDDVEQLGAVRINFEGDGAFVDSLVIDEGSGKGTVSGTFDEDHLTRRFYEKAEHLLESAGASDAEKPIILDFSGLLPASMMPLIVEEVDGSPSVANVVKIVVTNTTLTDDGGGQVSIDTGGGAGADDNALYLAWRGGT